MKVLEHTDGTLVLQDRPWLVGLTGGLFIAAGSWVALTSDERWFGAAFAVTGIILLLAFATTVTAEFNRTTGRFRRTTTGLARHSEIARPLGEIAGAEVVASPSGNPSRAYRIVLTLASGERVPLTPTFSSGKDDKERLAEMLRGFLDVQPAEKMPGFGEMVGMMSDPNAAERLAEMLGGPVEQGEDARDRITAARDAARSRGNHPLARELDLALQKLHSSAVRRR